MILWLNNVNWVIPRVTGLSVGAIVVSVVFLSSLNSPLRVSFLMFNPKD